MLKNFFLLPQEEQSQLITMAAYNLGVTPAIVEKDLWICWVLKQLFSANLSIPMAFKGGTSLSKAFGLIQRFSEDLDITLDYRGFKSLDQPVEKYTKSFIKKLNEDLKNLVKNYVSLNILPYLIKVTNELPCSIDIKLSDDSQSLRFYYPSIVSPSTYLAESVIIEFGGRNVTEPNENHFIKPYLSEFSNEIELPAANVNVLSPLKTFWEKVTLIHMECHRGRLAEQPNRLSRHWYDLAMLMNSPIGKQALDNTDLLREVVKHKQVFLMQVMQIMINALQNKLSCYQVIRS